MFSGTLFTEAYLSEGICESDAWKHLDPNTLTAIRDRFKKIFAAFPIKGKPNEAETEKDLIWPLLEAIGWGPDTFLPQQNLSKKGREQIPDGLLFEDSGAKAKANKEMEPWKRLRFGICIVEAKRWQRALDRRTGSELDVPSTQMLRYMRRADDVTNGRLRWGILTDGRHWRLYFQGALSVAEDFLDIDLGKVLEIPGCDRDLLDINGLSADQLFKVFVLMFGRAGFLPGAHGRAFHDEAREEGRHWEEKVAVDLSQIVFDDVFPTLVEAISDADPKRDAKLSKAYLDEVRQGALYFLYRLLFVLYAEDRNLLPDEHGPYGQYALTTLRDEIAKSRDERREYSDKRTKIWDQLSDIFRAIDEGDDGLGIPPYNGGLFQKNSAPILARAKLSDQILADVIFKLSHHDIEPRPKYINYRDLSVQQLGSIYERLLEHEVIAEDDKTAIRLTPFARKGSGSYYTPDDLVGLIIERTVGPLVDERIAAFDAKSQLLAKDRRSIAARLAELAELDPATRILDLKICDPAMGSGHFLVNLVDWLADRVLASVIEAEEAVDWAGDDPYVSPLLKRIAVIRDKISKTAKKRGWPMPEGQLDDRHVVRRMILKRCIYGVDLNPMAVELAKVALWLHTFTVGAPLSFLDHHLRCGNSLFGERVRSVLDRLETRGALFINDALKQAKAAVGAMEKIEALTDADIAEITESAASFTEVESRTRPIARLLDFIHAVRWADPKDHALVRSVEEFLDGQFGNPMEVLGGKKPTNSTFAKVLVDLNARIAQQRFQHWEVAFPGVWSNWESIEPGGGFDAVIGNPPWDRIKFQEVEWIAERKQEIAHAQRAADRKRMIEKLRKENDPIYLDYQLAVESAETAARVARTCGDYPLLSGGDTNIYALFVERAAGLIKRDGLVGLLTPSGIASDKTTAPFFRSISTTGRLASLFDFENKLGFFPDVDTRFKFCALTFAGTNRHFSSARCGFYLHTVSEIADQNRAFDLTAADFARVNPNTGTAPVFRTRYDAEITKAIYSRLPVLVDMSSAVEKTAYPVRYFTMLHMTNDSNQFVTRKELEKKAYPVGGNRWKKGDDEYVPLYEGKMVQAYDHRAASVVVNLENLNRPAQPENSTDEQHADRNWLPTPQFWIASKAMEWTHSAEWAVCFKDVASPTNFRTMIAAIVPKSGVGNTLPMILPHGDDDSYSVWAIQLIANLNSVPFDFVARQKVQGQHLNWFIVEQLPVVPRDAYARRFGKKSAAEIVKNEVLALTYTAEDMAAFARDMGHDGPPFAWDSKDRLRRRAKLDALYFLLTFSRGAPEEIEALRQTATYIFSTFPIVEREEMKYHGRYLSRDLCLAYINALAAGDSDAKIIL